MNTKDKRKIKSLAYHLIQRGKIKTTVPVAKNVRRKVEKLITRSRIDNVLNRRYIAKVLPEDGVNKLFNVIGPANKDRNGGYTRIIRMDGNRKGDGTEMCLIEIINV